MEVDEITSLLEELIHRFEDMRENGDSDMRTVIYHTNLLIEDIKETYSEDNN